MTATLPAREPFEHRQLQPVRVRIVVLLADENDVGAREIRRHRLEIGEGRAPRVVDTLRHVALETAAGGPARQPASQSGNATE